MHTDAVDEEDCSLLAGGVQAEEAATARQPDLDRVADHQVAEHLGFPARLALVVLRRRGECSGKKKAGGEQAHGYPAPGNRFSAAAARTRTCSAASRACSRSPVRRKAGTTRAVQTRLRREKAAIASRLR